jgi:hypothetical protein
MSADVLVNAICLGNWPYMTLHQVIRPGSNNGYQGYLRPQKKPSVTLDWASLA